MDDPSSIWLYLALSFLCLLFHAFFSLTETAFSSLNKYRLKVEANEGKRSAKLALKVYDHFESALITVLIGNNLVAVALSFLSTALFVLALQLWLNDAVISLIASIIVTILVYLFGETLPKQIAKRIPNSVAKAMVYPLAFFIIIFYPVGLLFRGLSFLVQKLFRIKKEPEITEEDFQSVVEQNEKFGLLEENESDLITASLDFSKTSVKEVLTPKERMFSIDLKGKSNREIADIICSTKYSRIPVYYGNPDKIVGILLVKQYLAAILHDPKAPVKDYLEKPYIVKPSIRIDDMVEGFRQNHTQIALVYKKSELIGMLTMEDVLEELIGPMNESAGAPRRRAD